MKNIHVLPTEKPSRLFNCFGKLEIGDYTTIRENLQVTNQHIYITNDEEITGFENNIWVIKADRIFLWQNTMALVSNNKPRKIILTTDQDLIKDGIQAIDDEFLEWFVENPSCKEVEVEEIDSKIPKKEVDGYFSNETLLGYKIIIPKEEPKQETLDEVAEKYAVGKSSNPTFRNTHIRDFKAGADWQVERMYSGEEVGELVYNIIGQYGKHYGIMIDGAKLNELFEQFKKK